MKVAGKGKIKKEDAVERAKELDLLKAKHKEVEQEKDEIIATKQTNESLWRNIKIQEERGEKIRKKKDGKHKIKDFKNAIVKQSLARIIAISKKRRGEERIALCRRERHWKMK